MVINEILRKILRKIYYRRSSKFLSYFYRIYEAKNMNFAPWPVKSRKPQKFASKKE
jgi:hypothetical protein